MRIIDLNIIRERTNLAIFIAPTLFTYENFLVDHIRLQGDIFSQIEEHCKKPSLNIVMDIINKGVFHHNFNQIMMNNKVLGRTINYIDTTNHSNSSYTLDSYSNELKLGELNAHNPFALHSDDGMLIRPGWHSFYYENFKLIFTPIGGLMIDDNNHCEILYINGVKKEHIKFAIVTKGVYGVTTFINSKYQNLYNRLFQRYKFKMFDYKEVVDFTGEITCFNPKLTPSNYNEITNEFTNNLVEEYLKQLSPKTLETYSKLGIKDYILDFGEEKVPEVKPVVVAPIVEESIDLVSFLQNAGVVDDIDNSEETIDSDILSYITTLNLEEEEQVQPSEVRRRE